MELGYPAPSIFIFPWALDSHDLWVNRELHSITFLPVLHGILLMPSKKEILKMLSLERLQKTPQVEEA